MDSAHLQRRSAFLRCLVCAATAVTLVSAQTPGRPPAATYRSGVNYVEVDAVVTDGRGQFVPGLQASDFALFEDGKPRVITALSLVDLPAHAGPGESRAPAGPPEDTTTNEQVRAGRLYAVVLDDLHTSPSHTQRVRAIVRRFVEDYVGADDMVALLSTAPERRIVTDFTSSHEILLSAAGRFVGRRPSWLPAGGTEGLRTQVACFT